MCEEMLPRAWAARAGSEQVGTQKVTWLEIMTVQFPEHYGRGRLKTNIFELVMETWHFFDLLLCVFER